MKKDWNRSMKNKAREVALSYTGPKKNILMLPGWDGLCVKTGLANGLFDANTRGIFVERDPLTHQNQKETLSRMFPKIQFFEGQLDEVPIDGEVFDYAFLDFTSPLTADVGLWLPRFADSLKEGGNVALTFAYATRGCVFGNALREFFRQTDAAKDYCYQVSCDSDVGDYKSLVYVAALRLLFLGHDISFENYIKYHDRNPMLLFMLTKGKQRRPTAQEMALRAELVSLCQKYRRRYKMAGTVAGARKAVKARSAKALAKRRSDIAKKAVATRRARHGW